jgi:hypothetical protein
METDNFTGDGSTTDFTLSSSVASEDNLIVFIEGVFQNKATYAASGTTIAFATAPANTRKIVVFHVRTSISGTSMVQDSFTGDGSTDAYTLSALPNNENNTFVYIDGVYQHKNTYSTSGTTLTFDTAPANSAAIEVMMFAQTTINVPASNSVTTSTIADGNVTTAKINDDAVTLAKMAALTRGSLIVGDASGNPSALAAGSANYVLTSDGTDISWVANDGVTTINNNADNRIITGSGTANTLNGESGLTYDGSTLAVASSASKVAQFERTGTSVFDLTIADVGDGASQLWFNAQTNDTGFNFRTKSSGGTTTNALFINPDGNVGIGTTSPSQGKVDILDAGDYDAHTGHGLTINSNANNAYTSMYMGADDSVDAAYIQSAGRNTSFTSKKLLLNPNGGNVGIGTISPSEKLSVLGGHISVGDSTGVAGTEFLLEGYREIYNGAKYGNTSIRTTYDIASNASDMLFYTASGGTNTAERMRIDSTGAMTRPNHPCFDVTTSTASLTGTIAFNTVNIDNNSNYSTSNGRFTAPVAGSYMFYTQYIKQNSNTVMRRRFDKNGAAALNSRELRLDTGNNYGYGSMTIIIDLAAGDYVTVNQTVGTAHGGETYEAFGGHLIG